MGLNKLNKIAEGITVDSKKILAKHNIDRAPVSLRIDKKLWAEFNAIRGAAEQNKLIEDLIREFLAGLKEKDKSEK